MRRHAMQYITNGMLAALTQFPLRPIVETRADAVASAADRLLGLGELPMTRPLANQYLPPQTFMHSLNGFMAGEITAVESVSRMEAGIMGFLAAEAVTIVPYVPYIPVVIELTLRVMLPDSQTPILRQAAHRLNLSWQAQGILELFVLDLDEWDWTDWEGHEARATRLGVELMAGRGPDMFLVDTLNDFRSAAEIGFLADFNTLIANHPTSDRSDFFEHILDALEIDGGLYMFPVSFGFYRVGINTAIPQPFVDRFMGYESISISGLFNFYLDFVEMHGHEYGHLIPGVPWLLGMRDYAIANSMAPFIDFERRTSNLNTTQFADFLTSFMRVYGRHEFIYDIWRGNFRNNETLSRRQQEHLFDAPTLGSFAADVFISRPQPFFTNYIPITDDFGNLVFNIRERNTWATWAVTNTGNQALAWEFLTYVLEVYNGPVGFVYHHPTRWAHRWALGCIATPIKRAHFEYVTRRTLVYVASIRYAGFKHERATPEWEQEIEVAIRIIAAHNENAGSPYQPYVSPACMGHFGRPHRAIAVWHNHGGGRCNAFSQRDCYLAFGVKVT